MLERPIMNVTWLCNECRLGPCNEHRLVDTNEKIDWNVMSGCLKDPALNQMAYWNVTFGGEE
jgi:hypothetical protein